MPLLSHPGAVDILGHMEVSAQTDLKRWLTEQAAAGTHSAGSFSIDAQAAERCGIPALRLHDVPLLLLAAAVEGGCREFRISDFENLQFRWDGPLGASWEIARSLLEHHKVDAVRTEHSLELPPFFAERLEPLSRRCRHAPLNLRWNGNLIASGHPEAQLLITPSPRARLILVDRGIDFLFPGAFQGLDIIAWVPPLPGAPWPRRLTWGKELYSVIRRIVETIEEHGVKLSRKSAPPKDKQDPTIL